MERRRVVVTGVGAVTPLANNVPETWKAILESRSGVGPLTRFDSSHLSSKIAAEIRNFDPSVVINMREARRIESFVQFAVVAAAEALQDSGFVSSNENAYRAGVAVAAGLGGFATLERTHGSLLGEGPHKISPFFIPGGIISMAPGLISMKYSLRGPNISIVTACTTGAHNIGQAARIIAHGSADVMVAGGTEMSTTPLAVGGFISARALSSRNDEPEKACRPWDKDRDGFVMGEGAGILVLEELQHALNRNAKIYAELIGFGMSADAYHMTSPEESGKGAEMSMRAALKDAGIDASELDYINAHGTSTHVGDLVEVRAIKSALGSHAYKVPISSTKSMTGHMLGAAGAAEAVFSVLAIRDQIAPATINLDNPDVECDLDFIPHKARKMKISTVLSNSFGFGGTNGSLVFRKL
ncbi:MAG TPA: beta-ketoacyl-ACP synthase II [Coxiellaceae bacterium]|nr:beta-ketoacyl-ACP synthase II [Coxiellaceae bacterium]